MSNFDYFNLEFVKPEQGKQLIIRGKIKNNSGRHYNVVAVRIILFNKSFPLVNTIIVLNGLPNGVTKEFEKYIEEVEYDKVAHLINKYEIFIESAF